MKQLINLNVGKKIIVACSGLFLVTFIIIHLSGNFLLYVGQDAFNTYSYLLTRNKEILYLLEAGIIIGFLAHILVTFRLTLKNRQARGSVGYSKKKTLGKSTIFSSNMGVTGSYILIFLVIHIKTFKYGEASMVSIDSFPGVQVKDLYSLVTTSFDDGLYSLFYCVGMVLLGGHLSHGLQSAFKSLGFFRKEWEGTLRKISILFGVVVGAGFTSIPLYFYFIG